MNRQDKEKSIAQLHESFTHSQASILVSYKGLSVAEVSQLRKKLRENGALMKVAKLTLVKRAIGDIAGAVELKPYLKEQLAIVFAQNESPRVAKALLDFAKEHEKLQVIAGAVESQVLLQAGIKALAKLPSREILIAQLLGTMQAPVSQFAGILNMLIVRLLVVLKEIEKKKAA